MPASTAMTWTGPTWKTHWAAARQHHLDWWNHRGLVLWATAPKDQPWEDLPKPPEPSDLDTRWFGVEHRIRSAEYGMSRTYFGGDSFPMLGTWSGAGDLAAYLGCPIELSPETIWFHPVIQDPDRHPPLTLDPQSDVFRRQVDLTRQATARARGRYLVSIPDLVENIDILASLRGTEALLLDMVERPDWVEERVDQINQVFFAAFDAFYDLVRDPEGGNTFVFNLWGPGKTCKVQCDACAMFSPGMFHRFVVPALSRQCRWLDYAMYHLDGETCLQNLDELLAIEDLDAIEWTPQRIAVGEGGGHPMFYGLYRRILKAGKSVQAICVKYEEVLPLLDAVGGRGMFIQTSAPDENAARRLEEKVAAYR